MRKIAHPAVCFSSRAGVFRGEMRPKTQKIAQKIQKDRKSTSHLDNCSDYITLEDVNMHVVVHLCAVRGSDEGATKEDFCALDEQSHDDFPHSLWGEPSGSMYRVG